MQAASNYTERSKNWIRDENPDVEQIQLVTESMGHKLEVIPANDERFEQVQWCIKFLNRIGRLKSKKKSAPKNEELAFQSIEQKPIQSKNSFKPDLGSLVADSDSSEIDESLLSKLKDSGLIATGRNFRAS